MRPPELHVVLVGLGRAAQAVDKVQQSAVLLVPAGVDGAVEDHLGFGDELAVAGAFGVLEKEPHALDVVAGVDDAALGDVQAGLALGTDVFKHTAELVLDVVFKDVVYALLGALLIQGAVLGVDAHQHACHVQIDHRDAKRAAAARLGDRLGAETGRVRHAVGQIPIGVIGAARPLQTGAVARDAVVFGVRHGIEGFREIVAALAQGLALGGHGEVHPIPGLVVETVGLHKVQAALRGGQPLVLHPVQVAQPCEDPAAAPLHPDALVGGKNLALAVQAGVDAAVDLVHAVFQPEVYTAVQLLADPLLCLQQFFSVHDKDLPIYSSVRRASAQAALAPLLFR